MNSSKQKVLILGGNSYIAQKFESFYCDDFDIRLIQRDVAFNDYFKISKQNFLEIDIVINCTAIVHKKNIEKKEYDKVNTQLVLLFAAMAKEAGVKQFIQLSTIAVYGDEVESIGANTLAVPVTEYGKSKLAADEALVQLNSDVFKVSILRPPMVYGKDAPGNMHSLIKLIRLGTPLPFKFFSNRRSFIYIENLLNAMALIMHQNRAGVFLLKDEEDYSIGKIVISIKKELQSKNLIFKLPSFLETLLLRKNSIFQKLYGNLWIDDSKTTKEIGAYACVKFESAMHKTLNLEDNE